MKVKIPIIVEGRYDKAKLSNVIDGVILTTDGFGIFKNAEKRALMKTLGKNGVIMLCDSDGGGQIIRSSLRGMLGGIKVYDLYVPQIPGKEKRKQTPSKAGYVGVEGVDDGILCGIFEKFASAHPELFEISGEISESTGDISSEMGKGIITKGDFYELGLTGHENSAKLRDRLAKEFALPSGMNANGLCSALALLGISRGEAEERMKSFLP